jgi:hypothetical protein
MTWLKCGTCLRCSEKVKSGRLFCDTCLQELLAKVGFKTGGNR